MFTGLVEAVGELIEREPIAGGCRLKVATWLARDLALGASVAVNGVCLTVHSLDSQGFQADVIPETLQRTTLGTTPSGNSVHLERALRATDRLGGHFVQGHVDGMATLETIQTDEKGLRWTVKPEDASLMKYIALKGSITLHGVSLTVTHVTSITFEVALVPHTLEETIFTSLRVGARLNIEVDILARTIEQLLNASRS